MKLAEIKNGLTIKDGLLSFNKTRELTPKQLAMLKGMSEHERNRYMLSLLGVIKTNVNVRRPVDYSTDKLKLKRSGSIADMMRRLKRFSDHHEPSQNAIGKWIGVEIECFVSNSDCDDEDEAPNWLKDNLSLNGLTRVNVKGDGSLSDDEGNGVEVTILFNSKYGFEPLARLCNSLNDLGCYVNKTCGLHVHLDARHLTRGKARKMGQRIAHTLPVLKWVVDETRHNNTYCQLDISPPRGGRYYAVNMAAYSKFKTIEIRLHGGSTNFNKIKNWIDLLTLIGQTKIVNKIETFQEFIDALAPSDQLVEYMERRISKLHGETAWAKLMPDERSLGEVKRDQDEAARLAHEQEMRQYQLEIESTITGHGMTQQDLQDYANRLEIEHAELMRERARQGA